MAKPRHLARAPITEAILDIQVAPRAGATFTDLQNSFPLDFGYRQQSFMVTSSFGFVLQPDAEVKQQVGPAEKIGLRLHSQDEKYVALVRTNGLSLSRLAPYENWDALEAEARKLWDLYVKRWSPDKVKGLATRYINNLRLPLKSGQDTHDFIITLMDLPPEVPQGLGPFVQQFDCMDPPNGQDHVRMALAWNGQHDGDRLPIILDISAYRAQELQPADPTLWSVTFRALRDLKNRCFFGTLTELAMKEYE
jgi:uncharacterized protein (TIGR04255 family)